VKVQNEVLSKMIVGVKTVGTYCEQILARRVKRPSESETLKGKKNSDSVKFLFMLQ